MKVFQFPLAKITIPFIIGIIICYWLQPSLYWSLFCFIGVIIALSGSYYISKKTNKPTVYFGILTYSLFFIVGILTHNLHNEKYAKENYIQKINSLVEPHSIQVVVIEKLKNSTKNDRYVGAISHIDGIQCTGKILINSTKNSKNEVLKIGSQLCFVSTIYPNRKPDNPNQFDYGAYLENKSISGYTYTSIDKIKINTKLVKNISYYSSLIRNKIIGNLKKEGFGSNELPVISALILGQQQEISSEILKNYQYAGAIHVLSVSGLHVGFILLFITFLLKPLPKSKLGNGIRLGCTIFSLWSFALLAGLSPSIVRATAMFTFVAIGMYLKRKTNVFHTLLVSLFLILLFVPSFLFDIGFQLSYLALFFILWLQPLLANLWIPKYKIITYFWEIITISFAAQLGTLPLSIYYFHQFPGLFFVTNCIVIPFLSIIMALGVLVMSLALFDFVPIFSLQLLQWLVGFLNKIIGWIASFDEFIIQDISFPLPYLFCSYLFIIASIIWFKKPTFQKLAVTLGLLFIGQLIYFGTQWQTKKGEEWIVYHTKKGTLISERIGEKVTVYCTSNLKKNTKENPLLKPYLIANFCSIDHCEILTKNLHYFKGFKIEIIDSTGIYSNKNSPDVLLLTGSPKVNLARLTQQINPKIIVADGSNYKSYVAHWKATCLKEKIPFHATGEKGFYRLK
jgi:competence protein ComEC